VFGPYNFYDHHFFGEAQLITSAAFKLFTNLKVKLLDLRGVVRMHKQREISECNSGRSNNDNSKNGNEEEKEENRHAPHMRSPPNISAVVAPMQQGII